MWPGAIAKPFDGLTVNAVPAYNISEGHTDFHPKAREDCGYIITLGGTTIYIAGDTEDNDDVLSLQGLDIVFLPVNQPYTMTVEQAIRTVKAIKPTLFYPYHYGQVEEKTDIDALVKSLEGVCDVRVFPME
jgi:L-ascorbate metabolism protein UlaG (beta-lactamase superfamily)